MMLLKSILLSLMFLVVAGDLQSSSPSPLYAVNYGTSDGTAYVTTFFSDQTAQTERLQQPLFVHYDSSDVPLFPRWAGHKLYGATFKTGDYQTAESTAITVFDALTGQSSTIVDLPRDHSNTQVVVDSVSPDEHYLWAFDSQTGLSYLVDLQTQTISHQYRCRGSVIAWLSGRVLVGNHQYNQAQFCDPVVYTRTLPPTSDGQNYPAELSITVPPPHMDYPTSGIVLSDGRILFGLNRLEWSAFSYWDGMASPLMAPVGLIELDKQHVQYWGVGHYISVSEDQRFASYVTDTEAVMRIDLTTLEVEQVGEAIAGFPYWEGNTLRFWQTDGTAISTVKIAGSERSEQLVYRMVEGDRSIIPPRGEKLGILREDDLTIYPPEAGKAAEPVRVIGRPPGVSGGLAWSSDGKWLHFSSGVTDVISESYNLETGERVELSGLTPISDSPDGEWWLYSWWQESEECADRLMAYHPATHTRISLLEDVCLGERSSFHLPPTAFYTWSEDWTGE